MAKAKSTTVALHPDADDALERLQDAVHRQEHQPRPTRLQVASALLCGTSPAQAAGMLRRFLEDHPGTQEGRKQPGPDE
jgi:predicted Zn-dependent protease